MRYHYARHRLRAYRNDTQAGWRNVVAYDHPTTQFVRYLDPHGATKEPIA